MRLVSISAMTALSFGLLPFMIAYQANSQVFAGQAQISNNPSRLRPLPLAHMYWHFLIYQNHLDMAGATRASLGKDGNVLRNHLQAMLGFSDADFAPIRRSSIRLAGELKLLDAEAMVVRKNMNKNFTSGSAQLNVLAAQREADINAEIVYLKQSLPPSKISIFETFLMKDFSSTTQNQGGAQ